MAAPPQDAEDRLSVEMLGPVTAWRGGIEVDLGSARRRAVLAVLALNAGHAVSREELVAGVWGDEPPAAVEGSLYSYVSGLRKVLDPDRARWSTGDLLASVGSGYQLRIDPRDVDVHRFTALRERAQDLAGRGETDAAIAALDEALVLWQGDALSGVTGPFAEQQRARLAELRLAALERRAELRLDGDDHDELAAELTELSVAHPMRESLAALVMRALHAAGRAADALAVYQAMHDRLVDELGIEPGPALRAVHDRLQHVDPDAARPAVPDEQDVFAGRDEHLGVLHASVAALAAGSGGGLWIEGEPGIGKTALVTRGLAQATAAGVQVLWGSGDELGARFSLRAILDCLGPVLDPDGPVDMETLLRQADDLGAHGPVIVVLDDVHWADSDSLLVWHRLTRRTHRRPVLLVAVCRTLTRRAEVDQVRAAMLDAGARLVELGELDEDAAADVVAALAGAEPGPSLLGLAERAVGNPMYLREIVEVVRRDDLLTIDEGLAEVIGGEAGAIPPSLAAAITARIESFVEDSRELLRWAALLGTTFDAHELSALMGRPVQALMADLAEATAAGLLGEADGALAFRHPLVRNALYESTPPSVRLGLHRQIAEILDRAGAPVERVAEHLLAAEVTADGWVVGWLLRHGPAVAASVPMDAVELLRRVLASGLAVGSADRETLTFRLARLLFWLGRSPEAEAHAVLAMTTDVERAAEMRLILAYLQFRKGEADEAVAALRRAVADPAVPEPWRARLQALQAMIERCGLDDADTAEDTAHNALARAEAAGDARSIAHALQDLWQVESVRRHHDRALDYVDQALAWTEDAPELADLRLSLLDNRLFALQNLDRLEDADRTLGTAEDLVARRNLPGGLRIPAAIHHYWRGRWREAAAELDAVAVDSPEITFYGLRQRGSILLLHGAAALIAGHRELAEQLELHLAAADEQSLDTAHDREHCDFLMAAAALEAEQRGRPDDALVCLMPVLDPKYAGMMLRHQWLPTIVRLAIDIGESTVVAQALDAAAAEAAPERPAARAAAALRWCRGLVDRAPDDVLRVAERYGAVGRVVEHAFALEDAAVFLAENGRTTEAGTALADAVLIYTDIGASWDIRRAEARLAPHGVRAPVAAELAGGSLRGLTPAERRVAELIAAGWSDAEIAPRLGLSPTAVRAHLARVRHKIGGESRDTRGAPVRW